MSARWPGGLHRAAGSTRNTGQRWRGITARPVIAYGSRIRSRLDLAGTVVLNTSGAGFVQLYPIGLGNTWHVEQVQVYTTTGPADQSRVILYHAGVTPNTILGQTAQGGGDTLGFHRWLDPGEPLIGVWSGGNPGDTATLRITGDQDVLV